MTGAELFVACLQSAGIDTIYGVPGEENADVMLALKNSDIDFVLTRHEQSAAYMASVHGKVIDRPAACLSTLGPGGTNLMTGVADAQLDHVPMLVLTGQAGRDRMQERESHQVIDMASLFAPVTKRSQTILSSGAIPGAVAEAVRLATEPKQGAVHLCLPEDIAGAEADGAPVAIPLRRPGPPAADVVRDAASAIRQARRPILVAGAGVVRAGAAEALCRLVDRVPIPLATTFMANGILPPEHGLALFTIGQPFRDHIDAALDKADLVVAVGVDPVEVTAARLTVGGARPVVFLGETPAIIDSACTVICDVVGALPAALEQLSAALDGHTGGLWPAARQARDRMRQDRASRTTADDDECFHAEDILRVVEGSLDEADTVLSGVGLHKMKIARNLAARRVNQIVIANGSAGMGMALPGALALARMDRPGRPMAICGDGEFLMNLQEMELACRENLSLTVLLWEDGGYGLIEAKQEAEKDTHSPLSFSNPDWRHLARAFGWTHLPVSTFCALPDTLDRARSIDGPVLVTMRVDYSGGLDGAKRQ